MKNKTQILMVHGGSTFRNYKDYLHHLKTGGKISLQKSTRWSSGNYLDKELGKKFEIIKPKMPLENNAKYEEWKIFFERYIPLLKSNIILIGSSLGGIFLVKYLSEHKFPKKILSTYIVSAPFDDTLPKADLVGGFKLKSDLSLLEKSSKNLYLMFSADDETVPVAHAEKYRKKLKDKKTKIIIYKSKNGHFKITKFPELIRMIKKDASLL